MITTPTVSGKPGQAPTGLSCDLYPLIGSHSTWTDPRGPVTCEYMAVSVASTGCPEIRVRTAFVVDACRASGAGGRVMSLESRTFG